MTNSVHISTAANTAIPDEICLFDPRKQTCASLGFVLQSIMAYEIFWIEEIYIHQLETQEPLILSVGGTKYNVTVRCLKLCISSSPLELHAPTRKGSFHVVFENIQFDTTDIKVQNIDITFRNVSFLNTSITDRPGAKGEHSQINVLFWGVQFEPDFANTGTLMSFIETFNVKIKIVSSEMRSSRVMIKGGNIILVASDSLFIDSTLYATASRASVVQITDTLFRSRSGTSQIEPVLRIQGNIVYANVTHSRVWNSSGLSFEKVYSGRQESCIQLFIADCDFLENKKVGSGAAVRIIYNSSTSHTSNFVQIRDSTFSSNHAWRDRFRSSLGGAIAIETIKFEHSVSVPLFVSIEYCTFTNNRAEDGGGALSVSSENVEVSLRDCLFLLNQSEFLSPSAAFVLVLSNVAIHKTTFVYKLEENTIPLIEMQVMSSEHHIGDLQFTVVCLPWSKLLYTTSFGVSSQVNSKVLQKFVAQCSQCHKTAYVPSTGIVNVSYQHTDTLVLVKDHSVGQSTFDPRCINCPYGGHCSDTGLRAKPNFWGYIEKDKVVFAQCPAEYCCSGGEQTPCSTHNSCTGNRSGTLCGACKTGFSLSLLSNRCLPEDQCTASWLWPLIVLAVFLYMMWYTFKDDVTNLLLCGVSKMFRKIHKINDEHTDKGYFGILAYHVQALGMLHLTFLKEAHSGFGAVIIEAHKYITFILSVELSFISRDICPLAGMTISTKLLLNFVFLCGIYFSWCMMCAVCVLVGVAVLSQQNLTAMQARFLKGIVEIIKYTYGGFASLVFFSLTCTSLTSDFVWFYDGTIKCFSQWQIFALVLCIVHTVPFPLSLPLGTNLLQKQKISSVHFMLGCVFPLPFCIYWIAQNYQSSKLEVFCQSSKKKEDFQDSTGQVCCFRSLILECFQGPYRKNSRVAKHWESVMVARRLLLSATTLMPRPLLQLGCSTILCILFFGHHIHTQPFVYRNSNKVESLSLLMLIVVANLNLVKSIYTDLGAVPQGPAFNTLHNMMLIEKTFLIILIIAIVFLELKGRR